VEGLNTHHLNSCVVRQTGKFGPPYGLPRYIHTRPVASGVTVAAVWLLQIWMDGLGIRKISKAEMSIGQLKMCALRCGIRQPARNRQAVT